jgi:hypothetical protein
MVWERGHLGDDHYIVELAMDSAAGDSMSDRQH